MSVEQINAVDAIGIESVTGEVVLTISDHLDWVGGDSDHLFLLQEKINTYMRFIEAGEISDVESATMAATTYSEFSDIVQAWR